MPRTRTACVAAILLASGAGAAPGGVPPGPITLDDIHFIVTDPPAARAFFRDNFCAREMAHPEPVPVDFISFQSVRLDDPTINVSGAPAPGETDAGRRRAWAGRELFAVPPDAPPAWGIHALALKTRDLEAALARLPAAAGARPVRLPHDAQPRAVQLRGPDNIPVLLVERPSDAGPGDFGVDHLQILAVDAGRTARFLADVLDGAVSPARAGVQVVTAAGATLVVTEPEPLGVARADVRHVPRAVFGGDGARVERAPGRIDHLGFLFLDVDAAAAAIEAKGYRRAYPVLDYRYGGRLTPYRLTAFMAPEGFAIEIVSARGRSGPQMYYRYPGQGCR